MTRLPPQPSSEECEPDQKPKHVILHESIQQFYIILLNLERLQHRITNTVPEAIAQEIAKEPKPSLINVLDQGPETLNHVADRMQKEIDGITQLLFG